MILIMVCCVHGCSIHISTACNYVFSFESLSNQCNIAEKDSFDDYNIGEIDQTDKLIPKIDFPICCQSNPIFHTRRCQTVRYKLFFMFM